jgi:hypothetical protein
VEYGNIYGKLEDIFRLTGEMCCVDLAFGQVNREYLYESSQDLFGSLAPTHQERNLELREKRQATSAQQTAEWGMRVIQM